MEIILRIILINLLCIIFPYIASAENNSKTVIKIIDKVSGKNYIHEVSKGKLLKFRAFDSNPDGCALKVGIELTANAGKLVNPKLDASVLIVVVFVSNPISIPFHKYGADIISIYLYKYLYSFTLKN